MAYYNNIESFYETNKMSLIKGEFRPVVSYNKDAEEYINKLVKIYEDNNFPEYVTVSQIEKGLNVTKGSNVATTESPLTWIGLGLVEEMGGQLNKKDPNYKYKFTDDFRLLAQNKMIPGVHILNKLYSINSLSTISKFTNLLLCTLREGYIEDYIIDFPRDNKDYVNKVIDREKRNEFSLRVDRIYGYGIDIDSSPHASMRAINNLVKLELIRQKGENEFEFPQYEITEYGHRLLEVINANLGKGGVPQNAQKNNENYFQKIFFGAPGTGKSHQIEDDTEGASVIRTTFHPDSDYSTFVGAYKPCMEPTDMKVVPVVVNNGISLNQNNGTFSENRISYKFVKQAFLKAYLGAWKKMTENPSAPKPQYLIIEEINRGNCAQIFGDLFQLLDRGDKGYSAYTIDADTDLQKAIAEAFKSEVEFKLENDIDASEADIKYTSNYEHEDGSPCSLSEDIQAGRILLLPRNLYIWATMNTSDQSLFPIDSAFKRRWEWVYMPIKDHKDKDYKIEIDDTTYDWWGFLEKINSVINTVTNSEDKKLGYFFVKTDKKIDAKKFVGKVLFYLWNDVFKNYGFDNPIFNKEDKNKYVFSDFFQKDGSPETDNIKRFLKNLDETIDKEKSFTEKKPEEATSTTGNNNPDLFANQE